MAFIKDDANTCLHGAAKAHAPKGIPENDRLIPRQSVPLEDMAEFGASSRDGEIRGDEYGEAVLSLFERSGIGLAVLDPRLRIRAANAAFLQQCSCRDDVAGQGFADFLHPSVRHHLMRQFDRLLQGRSARIIGRPVAMWVSGATVTGKLTAFSIEDAGRGMMILVQFTPDRSQDQQMFVDPQRKLTELTAKILEGVAAGDPTVRLAAKLFLSRQGVEYHVSILLRQFKVPNRTALAAKAYSMGMFSIGCWPPKVLPEYIRTDRDRGRSGRSRGESDAAAGRSPRSRSAQGRPATD